MLTLILNIVAVCFLLLVKIGIGYLDYISLSECLFNLSILKQIDCSLRQLSNLTIIVEGWLEYKKQKMNLLPVVY